MAVVTICSDFGAPQNKVCAAYDCGQESLIRNGVAIIVNKRVQNAVLVFSLKNDRNDLCSFPRQTIQYHGNPSLCPDR